MTALVNTETGELLAHPYASKFPLLGESDMAELVESIRSNGLRNPVVVTTDGLILDGRNRAFACWEIGIDPETVVYDGDDLAEYVIDCNVTRRNMTTGARAMGTALVLAADGRRKDGRWKRNSVQVGNDESANSGWAARLKEAGIVLDHKPDLAPLVVAGELALDAAYAQAKAERDAEDQRLAAAAREAEREAQAQAFIEAKDPDLAAQVGGPAIATYGEAVAVWERRNAEEVQAERKRAAEHKASVDRHTNYLRAFLSGVTFAAQMPEHPLRDEVLNSLAPHDRDRFLRIEKEASWPTTD